MLEPVRGCLVRDMTGRDGSVLETRRGQEDRVAARIRWRDGHESWHAVRDLSSAFQIGMGVELEPSAVGEKAQAGWVEATRRLAGRDRVSVRFHETGETLQLPFERLRFVETADDRFRAGKFGPHADHAERFRLRLLASALRQWNDVTGALDRLDVDPLPHQIHLAHRVLSSAPDGINWLIADDVGLGKTIEVGLILNGLKRRNLARRVLIVCPAGLTRQWQDEMKVKFDRRLDIHGRDFLGEDPETWRTKTAVVISLDRAKQPKMLAALAGSDAWDVIVFDEAHRLGRDEDGTRTARYRLAEALRPLTPALLLLSGTPHQGKTDRFKALLELLRPDLKARLRTLQANPEVVGEVVLRNRKSRVTDAHGKLLFHGQETVRVPVEPSEATRRFSDDLEAYLRRGYDAGRRGGEGRAIGFVMTTYRKLASSSVAAIRRALERRRARLLDGAAAAAGGGTTAWPEAGEDEAADDIAETLKTERRAFFHDEPAWIDRLLLDLEAVVRADEKLAVFVDRVARPAFRKGEKLLVFTEYRATQAYLQHALEEAFPQAGIALLHGGLSLDEKLEAIRRFNDDAAFLISTEAGGEGFNLQKHCRVLVNYDLPWNPARLVQRVGRLYRYGQTRQVTIINLQTRDTFDNAMLDLMLERVEAIARDLAPVGSEFNANLRAEILGELLEAIDMEGLLSKIGEGDRGRTEEEIRTALDEAKRARELEDDVLGHAVGFDRAAGEGTFGLTLGHARDFVRAMLPRIGATGLRELDDGRVLEFRLPPDAIGRHPEFGRREIVRVTTDRAVARHGRDVFRLDFRSAFFRFLIDNATSRAFDGYYATCLGPAAGTLALYVATLLDERGGPVDRQLLPLWRAPNGSVRVLRPREFADLVDGGLRPASGTDRISGDNKEIHASLTGFAEARLAERCSARRHPGDLVLLAIATVAAAPSNYPSPNRRNSPSN